MVALTTELGNHWKVIDANDGKRMYPDFSYGAIPYGWVVDAQISQDIRKLFQCPVIPLKPGGWNIIARLNALFYINAMRRTYLDGFMLMVPHDRTKDGYLTRFVYLEDLRKDPNVLLQEVFSTDKSGNKDLAESKECAYTAITGISDLG